MNTPIQDSPKTAPQALRKVGFGAGLISLVEAEKEVGQVSRKQEDVFSLETFDCLMDNRLKAKKDLIIAAAQTRDRDGIKVETSFYDAYPFSRLLFKRKGSEIVHRYHRTSPLVVLNPLTNQHIVGEIKYFRIRIGEKGKWARGAEEGGAICGEFIGTDFNFAYSKEFRHKFYTCALEPHDFKLVEIGKALDDEKRIDMLDDGSSARPLNPTAVQNSEQSHVAFPKACLFGWVLGFYFLIAFLVLTRSIIQIEKQVPSDNINSWFAAFLPFFSAATDFLSASILKQREPCLRFSIKLSLWCTYFVLPSVLFGGAESSESSTVRNVLDIVCPLIFVGYSIQFFQTRNRTVRLV